MVAYAGEKMSKSLGNLVFVSDLLKVADPRAIRLALLRHHYRAGFEWFDTDLDEGKALLRRLMAAADLGSDPGFTGGADPRPFAEEVRAALDDDLNVPRALDALDDLASAILSGGDHLDAPATLLELADLVGVDLTLAARSG
jgi:L-cysteine:1D-myo-inositol 2-amino-2-deoxy-alpha-D-glucopyranoside ligase